MHSSSWLKDLFRSFVPSPVLRIRQRWRNRRREQYSQRLWSVANGKILSGPFKNMKYLAGAVGSSLGPKILGSYESELHPVIETFTKYSFDILVNVGAAEGYYVIGLLIKIPSLRAVAFESDPHGLQLLRELANLNDVSDRLSISGFCAPNDLATSLGESRNPLVIMDIEGAEDTLLEPTKCPALLRASLLVEVHEFLRPGVTDKLLSWFGSTHNIQRIPTVGETGTYLPMVPGFSWRQIRLLADEMRSARMEWMWITPRVKGNIQ